MLIEKKISILIGLSLLFLFGCDEDHGIIVDTQYQVVFLDNNNAYIGKMQQAEENFIHLTNVFYFQVVTDPESKLVSNTLVKRGNELHKPDFMYINTHHILMIEPVSPDSQVAKLIEQSETEGAKPTAPSETEKK